MPMLRSSMILLPFVASCVDGRSESFTTIKDVHFSATASFSRDAYVANFTILDERGGNPVNIACYSLDDQRREKFAEENRTDPVADLSCYVKDMRRVNEFTMLGFRGESLQFTPGFFWFSDVNKCNKSSYHMNASLRGMKISFKFSDIDAQQKTAKMEISASSLPSAKNSELTTSTYEVYCS